MNKPILFSFFSGSGFLDLGFELNGFDVQFVNEYHVPFLKAYQYSRSRLGISTPKFGVDSSDIDHLVYGEGRALLSQKVSKAKESGSPVGFIGGPPCPDFSVGGKNRGHEGENGRLTRTYVDGIIKYAPDFFIFENVKGLWRTKRHREFYEQMKANLVEAGYELADRLTNSIEYGVPQDRDRIILFGVKKASLSSKLSKPLLDALGWESYVKYDRDRILGSEAWPTTSAYREDSKLPLPKSVQGLEQLTVEYWFNKNNVSKHPNSCHHFVPRAALSRFQTIDEGDVGKKSFKRLHRWRYSPTAAYGNNEVHIHPYKSRRISAAEALAIQSLPKEFELPADMSLSNMFKTIGNGVPYLLSEGIAQMVSVFIGRYLSQELPQEHREAAQQSQ
ncbi:modification methylase NmeDIP [Aliidiomarina taiwanensis]|uniref:DNA (cytosine-5-)-methyltransferase n=1 Tax=Aliidiomarina taiwanensis TaxID=946228 RepID=A0A432WYP5_9GAMM|nr:DNA cytosine methyltransferase [Aliidiomarina taiwanensis]RUO38876.1 modification methylase NmeDIP [Aliidiomarina taiwanensis]